MHGKIVSLDTPLNKFLPTRRAVKTAGVGIEIEAEGRDLPFIDAAVDKNPKYWTVVREGSLRGNCAEYITNGVIPIGSLDDAADEFDELMKKAKFDESLRTSTHIHINMYGKSLRQLYSVLSAYWLLENPFLQLAGKSRQGNLFCLRLKDAEFIINELTDSLNRGSNLGNLIQNNNRYAALNLASIAKFGSIEFRFMPGMYTSAEFKPWVKALWRLVEKASEMEPRQVFELLEKENTAIGFMKHFMSEYFIDKVTKHYKNNYDELLGDIYLNVGYVALLLGAIDHYELLSNTKGSTVVINHSEDEFVEFAIGGDVWEEEPEHDENPFLDLDPEPDLEDGEAAPPDIFWNPARLNRNLDREQREANIRNQLDQFRAFRRNVNNWNLAPDPQNEPAWVRNIVGNEPEEEIEGE